MEGQSERRPELGFGVAGALAPAIVAELARAAEGAGYRTFWVNDTPGGDGLAALAAAAATTRSIRLGVGVIPLDRQPADRIAARLTELGLPVERLTIGVGSGGAPGGPDRVRDGVETLRGLTAAAITVGALGPRMCRLAGEVADGVLLNWLIPDYVRVSAGLAAEAARTAGRSRPRIDGYVRVALGGPARDRLRMEGDRYGAIPAYAAHFARMGVPPLATAVAADDPAEIRSALAPFAAALDETVVRAIVGEETEAAYRALLDATAPGGGR